MQDKLNEIANSFEGLLKKLQGDKKKAKGKPEEAEEAEEASMAKKTQKAIRQATGGEEE